jgi:isopentenyl diphosphate isomerase/L-lactate dehydrogenase-like FMN-dependent dehydrogenase
VRSQERDHRHGFSWDGAGAAPTLEPERVMRNFRGRSGPGVPTVDTFFTELENALDWPYFEWLRGLTSLPVVVKGVQTREDALESVRHGADAVVVSNHGGHALFDAGGTIDTLPEVVDAVEDRIEVYLDGGVRRGTDVLKALALGARAVLLGRAYLWGLCAAGADGVEHAYRILAEELKLGMTYCGVRDVKDVPASLVRAPAPPGDVVGRLKDLADLNDRGRISAAEYEELKAMILSMPGSR